MFSLTNRCCMLLLAVPLAAAADPVAVTTHSSGMLDPHPVVLGALGLDYSDYTGGPLPYELTISSTFGPAGPGYFDFGEEVSDYNNDVAISFKLGDSTYHYAGKGAADVRAHNPDNSYRQEIWFVPPEDVSDTVFISNFVVNPAGSLSGPPLTPRTLESNGAGTRYVQFNLLPNNPDNPGYWSMLGNAQSMSLQVSAVPEPGQLGMLLTGVLTLGLWRRREFSGRRPHR